MDGRERPIVDAESACACGAVRLAVRGKVLRMFNCTCSDCQKSTGTGHQSVVLVKAADVEVAGDCASFSVAAASGATMTRHFCPRCGTPVYAQSSRTPHLRMLPAGFFDGAPWFRPDSTIFARSERAWDRGSDRLPHFETYWETP